MPTKWNKDNSNDVNGIPKYYSFIYFVMATILFIISLKRRQNNTLSCMSVQYSCLWVNFSNYYFTLVKYLWTNLFIYLRNYDILLLSFIAELGLSHGLYYIVLHYISVICIIKKYSTLRIFYKYKLQCEESQLKVSNANLNKSTICFNHRNNNFYLTRNSNVRCKCNRHAATRHNGGYLHAVWPRSLN